MRAKPFVECTSIPVDQRSTYECSDRILFCRAQFEKMGFNPGPNLLYISNSLGKSVVGIIHSFHEETDILYLPSWMIHTLQALTDLSISSVSQRACTNIVLQPYSTGLYTIPDWATKLNKSLRNYDTLTTGNTIALNIDGIQLFRVEKLYPPQYMTMYLRLQEEIELTILPSVSDDKKQEYSPFMVCKGRGKKKKQEEHAPFPIFYGTGYALGGRIPDDPTLSPSALMFAAALSRTTKK
jgi:hypothetical protein